MEFLTSFQHQPPFPAPRELFLSCSVQAKDSLTSQVTKFQ